VKNTFEPVLLDQIALKRALKFKTELQEGYVYVTNRNTFWVWLPHYKVWVKSNGKQSRIAEFSYKPSTISKQNPDGLSLQTKVIDFLPEVKLSDVLDNYRRVVIKYDLDNHPRLKVDGDPDVPDTAVKQAFDDAIEAAVGKNAVTISAEEFVGIPEPGVEITEQSTPDDFDAAIWDIVHKLTESSTAYNAQEWAEEQLLKLGVKPPTREVLIRVSAHVKITNQVIIDALTPLGVTVIEID
jgi:hypothetical protein